MTPFIKAHVLEGHLEFSSLMPRPERWVKAADYEAFWNDPAALQRRLMELSQANPTPGAEEHILQAIDLREALDKKTPQQLVDLCLDNLTTHTTDESFASLVEEICTRLDPTWGERT